MYCCSMELSSFRFTTTTVWKLTLLKAVINDNYFFVQLNFLLEKNDNRCFFSFIAYSTQKFRDLHFMINYKVNFRVNGINFLSCFSFDEINLFYFSKKISNNCYYKRKNDLFCSQKKRKKNDKRTNKISNALKDKNFFFLNSNQT